MRSLNELDPCQISAAIFVDLGPSFTCLDPTGETKVRFGWFPYPGSDAISNTTWSFAPIKARNDTTMEVMAPPSASERTLTDSEQSSVSCAVRSGSRFSAAKRPKLPSRLA